MGTPNPAAILRVPGILYADGTALGLTRGIEFRVTTRAKRIAAEEWGGATSKVIYTGEGAVLAGVARSFDADMLARIFPNVSGAVVTGTVDGDVRAGTVLPPFVLRFVPLASSSLPGLRFGAAVGLLEEQARMRLALNDETGFPFVFEATPDDDGKLYTMGIGA